MNNTGSEMKQTTIANIPILGCLRFRASDKGITSIDFVKRKTASHKPSSRLMKKTIKELKLYAEGKLKVFSVPVDISGVSVFTRRILNKAKKVSYGKTISYGQLASAVGKKSACRAAGRALGRNPVPVIIPCHRVIRADGSWGGFSAGKDVKRKLLAIEGVRLTESKHGKP